MGRARGLAPSLIYTIASIILLLLVFPRLLARFFAESFGAKQAL